MHTAYTQLINLIQEYGFNSIIDLLVYYVNLDEDEWEDEPDEGEVEKILKEILRNNSKEILNLYLLKLIYLYQKKNFEIYNNYDTYMIMEEERLKRQLEIERKKEEERKRKEEEEKERLRKLKKEEKRKKRKEEKRRRKEEKKKRKEEKRKRKEEKRKKKEEKNKKKTDKKEEMNWKLVPTYEDYLKIS